MTTNGFSRFFKARPAWSLYYYGLVLLLLASGVIGCSKRYNDLPSYSPFTWGDYDNKSVGRFKTSYIVQQIDQFYRGTDPGPIAITTFVNLDDLHASSSFGRLVAEHVLSELSMRGYDVIELRKSDSLNFVDESGEFVLSRSSSNLRPYHDLGGVVVGTYSVSNERVFLNARLLDPQSSMVLAAASVELSKTGEIQRLLRRGGVNTTMERIPAYTSKTVQVPIQNYPNGQYSQRGTVKSRKAMAPKVRPRLPGMKTKK